MYRFQVISNGYIFFSTNEFNNFLELVTNTNFGFDFVDKYGYETLLLHIEKLNNIFK